MKDTIKLHALNVVLIAHRGLSGLERENTNAAFVAAGNRSYYGVETDIHRTADGQFVVFHDDYTNRLTDVDWRIEDHTLDELRKLVLNDLDGQKRHDLVMPTLQEYIRICKKYNKISVLELKNHLDEDNIVKVIKIIQQESWLSNTIFISFDLPNLLCVRKLLPNQNIQYLVKKMDDDVFRTMVTYQLDADVDQTSITAEWVKKLHNAGRLVNVWTVNDLEAALRMLRLGVDQITTDILE